MAEFFCVTCPVRYAGLGPSYEIGVFGMACEVLAIRQTVGGQLQVEIDPGPTIRLIEAPPLGDWLPGDSIPVDPATIPCAPP